MNPSRACTTEGRVCSLHPALLDINLSSFFFNDILSFVRIWPFAAHDLLIQEKIMVADDATEYCFLCK